MTGLIAALKTDVAASVAAMNRSQAASKSLRELFTSVHPAFIRSITNVSDASHLLLKGKSETVATERAAIKLKAKVNHFTVLLPMPDRLRPASRGRGTTEITDNRRRLLNNFLLLSRK